MRIGTGYDVHRFRDDGSTEGLRLGGVDVPGAPQLDGHSDGDALIHAPCSARPARATSASISRPARRRRGASTVASCSPASCV